jgi:hypothetical protein
MPTARAPDTHMPPAPRAHHSPGAKRTTHQAPSGNPPHNPTKSDQFRHHHPFSVTQLHLSTAQNEATSYRLHAFLAPWHHSNARIPSGAEQT